MNIQAKMHELVLMAYMRAQEVLQANGYHDMITIAMMPSGDVQVASLGPMLKLAEKAYAEGNKNLYNLLKNAMWDSLKEGLRAFNAQGVIVISEVWIANTKTSNLDGVRPAREYDNRREALTVTWEYKTSEGKANGAKIRFFRRENNKAILEEEQDLANCDQMIGAAMDLLPD